MRTLIWDIETSNLNADFGVLHCIGYKWLHEKSPKVVSSVGLGGEKALVKHFVENIYATADVTVAYNGKRFDLPYLQAKYLGYFRKPLPPVAMVDPYYTVRHKLRISRKSLMAASDFLNLKHKKEGVSGRVWFAAMTGSRQAVNEIIRHCKADVLLLEELYLTVRSMVTTHPRMGPWGNCRHCGADALIRRGRAVSKNKTPQFRFQCKKCASWETL